MSVHVEWLHAPATSVTFQSRKQLEEDLEGESNRHGRERVLVLGCDDVVAITGTKPELRRLLQRMQEALR